VAENTASTGDAVKTPPETPTAQQVAQPTDETGGRNLQSRIDGLVAEKARKEEQITKLQEQYNALVEKTKTEDEKRLDEMVKQRVESEYGPVKQRLERMEADYTAKRDRLLAALPEEARDCYDPDASIEVQLHQIEIVASHLSSMPKGAVLSSGAPPSSEPPKQISWSDYSRWAALASRTDEASRKQYDEMKPRMIEFSKSARQQINAGLLTKKLARLNQ
jgi:hypothetical protein